MSRSVRNYGNTASWEQSRDLSLVCLKAYVVAHFQIDHCFVEEGDEVLTLAAKLDRHANISRLSSKRIGKGYITYKSKVSRMVNGIKKKPTKISQSFKKIRIQERKK